MQNIVPAGLPAPTIDGRCGVRAAISVRRYMDSDRPPPVLRIRRVRETIPPPPILYNDLMEASNGAPPGNTTGRDRNNYTSNGRDLNYVDMNIRMVDEPWLGYSRERSGLSLKT